MAGAWAKAWRGMHAPLVVVQRARLAGEPWRAYVKLVRLQLVLALLALGVAAYPLVRGIEAVAGHRRVVVTSHGVEAHGPVAAHAHDEANPDDDRSEGTIEAAPDDVDAPQEFLATHAPALVPLWLALGSLYAAWILIELAMSMLWAEHFDWLTEQLTRGAGLRVHQPIARPPRVRLNLRWAVQKVWRQLLAALMIASGAPFFLVAYLAPRIGPTLYAVVLGLWTIYWLFVTTAAKSASAWATPPDRAPWFLRSWTGWTMRTPGFRWFAPRLYGRAWTWLTHALHGAALTWEARPYEFAGLAVVRVVATLPLVSVLVKPLLPTAAELVASGALDGDEVETSQPPELA